MAKKQSENDEPKRSQPMRAELNDAFIKRLRLSEPPIGYDKKSGKLIFGKDPDCASYILWDSAQSAPPGFGVKVAGKKTYILRRKVDGKSIMPTVGNFADFKDIDAARKKAAEMALFIMETGRNPNQVSRQLRAVELTLGGALASYREHMVKRVQRPASKETLRVYDRVVKQFDTWKWSKRQVSEITTDEIVKQFQKGREKATANEQTFRWASRAVSWCISHEKLAAAAARRKPTIDVNPFEVLVNDKHYRSKEQIDSEREEKGVRNPLGPKQDLGKFLEVAWSKRLVNDNMTGIHFLMLMLLWGCRKSEHAECVWGELLKTHGEPGESVLATSHVFMEDHEKWGPYVFFYKTKNRRNHRLPLTPMALNLLRMRQQAAAEEVTRRRGFAGKSRRFVFPARSPLSKSGHYSDATDLLDDLREELGLERLTPHDLRRSFGAVMEALDVSKIIRKRFLNHADSDVTDSYTKAEWELLRQEMARIEQGILVKAPNVYNALKPVDWPAIAAPPPHVSRPPKPRTGRPRKAVAKASKSE